MSADAVGGIWAYAEELANELARQDCEVVLAGVGPIAPPDESVPYRSGKLEWQDDPWRDVHATREWLLGLADDVRPDVVHLNSYAFATAPWPAPTVLVGHSCVCSWFDAVRNGPAPPAFDRYRDVVRRGLHAADAVVAPTAWMLGELRRHHGLRRKASVIHNGIAVETAQEVTKERVVLAAGRLWDEAKGLDAIDDAASHVTWRVEVAGDPGDLEARRAVLLGPVDRLELRERMRSAGIFVHPARYEPFGLAPLEAAAGGCALVLGNIATLRGLWDGAALFVPPGNGQALATAIEILARDEVLRERLGRAARERAQRFSAAAMARSYARLYSSLVERTEVAA